MLCLKKQKQQTTLFKKKVILNSISMQDVKIWALSENRQRKFLRESESKTHIKLKNKQFGVLNVFKLMPQKLNALKLKHHGKDACFLGSPPQA